MAENEQRPNQDERESNRSDNSKTHPDRMIHVIIHRKNQRGKSYSNDHEDHSTDQFPLPRGNKENDQDNGRDRMHQKMQHLFRDGQPGIKRIHGKQFNKSYCQDTQNPRYPMNDF